MRHEQRTDRRDQGNCVLGPWPHAQIGTVDAQIKWRHKRHLERKIRGLRVVGSIFNDGRLRNPKRRSPTEPSRASRASPLLFRDEGRRPVTSDSWMGHLISYSDHCRSRWIGVPIPERIVDPHHRRLPSVQRGLRLHARRVLVIAPLSVLVRGASPQQQTQSNGS
jgi:hypothetical protein